MSKDKRGSIKSNDSGISNNSTISDSEVEGFPASNEHSYNDNKSDTQSVQSLDSGYGSDKSQSEIEPNLNISKSNVAEARIQDVKRLIGRLDFYKTLSMQVKSEIDNRITFNQSIFSVINDLGAENFRNSLSSDMTEKLISALIKNSEYIKIFSPNEKDKINFNIAKTEANLKGFVLQDIQDPIAFEAAKQVILELKGQEIPKSDYANIAISKTIERLQKDLTLSPEQLESFKQDVSNADKNPKIAKELAKLSENDRQDLSKAVEESANSFIKELDNENEKVQRNIHSLTIADQTIQELFTEKKLQIQPNEEDKIKNKLMSALSKLGSGYLEKNIDNISKSLTENIAKIGNISWWKRNFTISDKNLDAVVSKLESQEFITSADQEKPDLSNKILTAAPENRVSAISVTCTKIVNDAIKKVHQNTGKTFNWEERNKIQESLVNGLLNLDDEYLKNNSFKLVEDIAQDLKNNSKSRWFSSKLKISPIKLEKIVDKINIIVGDNNKFNEEKALIFSDANIDNPALADKLSKFLNENNIDINKVLQPADRIITEGNKIGVEDLKLITNKQFIELRKNAPESFDRIIFSKDSKISSPTNTPNLKRRESKNSITSSV